MYGTILKAMDDTSFWKLPKFLRVAKISPLSLYLFARMLDHYHYHRDNSRNVKHRQSLKDGWFYWTYPDIQEHVGIRERQARGCMDELDDLLLIERKTIRSGLEQKCWYRINEDKLLFYLERYRAEQTARTAKEQDATDDTATAGIQEAGTEPTAQQTNQELINQDLKKQDLKKQELTKDCSEKPNQPLSNNSVSKYTKTDYSYLDALWKLWIEEAMKSGDYNLVALQIGRGRFNRLFSLLEKGYGWEMVTGAIKRWFGGYEFREERRKAGSNIIGWFHTAWARLTQKPMRSKIAQDDDWDNIRRPNIK
ncbi:MAG: hypothetical protein LLG37_08545 [Spirochaetia bacterium]|nr:hypothetical protein [Spirochaetia bacterium]